MIKRLWFQTPGTVHWIDVSNNASNYINEKIGNKGSQIRHIKKYLNNNNKRTLLNNNNKKPLLN